MKSEQEYEPQEAAQRIKDNLRKAGYIVSQFRGTLSIGPQGHANHPPVFLFGEKRVYVNFLNGAAFACKSFRLLLKSVIELFATPERQYELLKSARFQGWLVEVDGDDWRSWFRMSMSLQQDFPLYVVLTILLGFSDPASIGPSYPIAT
ncbi:MAG: hypothetical protein C0478_04515 [Planctomyces sp.]|nr:hypothetical protein [Planctomyces sp.]